MWRHTLKSQSANISLITALTNHSGEPWLKMWFLYTVNYNTLLADRCPYRAKEGFFSHVLTLCTAAHPPTYKPLLITSTRGRTSWTHKLCRKSKALSLPLPSHVRIIGLPSLLHACPGCSAGLCAAKSSVPTMTTGSVPAVLGERK